MWKGKANYLVPTLPFVSPKSKRHCFGFRGERMYKVVTLKQFSIKYRNNRAKVITLAYHRGHRQSSQKAQENMCKLVMIGFGDASFF